MKYCHMVLSLPGKLIPSFYAKEHHGFLQRYSFGLEWNDLMMKFLTCLTYHVWPETMLSYN